MWIKGSFTVEAALVFPIVLAVVLFLIYSAFYIHNREVLTEAAYETAVYGSVIDRTDSDSMKRKMLAKCSRAVRERLISAKTPTYYIEVDKNQVTVSVSSKMQAVQLVGLENFYNTGIQAKRSAIYVNPVDRVRLAASIRKLAEK